MKSLVSLIGFDGARHLVSPAAIARITEAGASSQWHGIRAFVKLFDGHTLEVRQTAEEVGLLVAAGQEAGAGPAGSDKPMDEPVYGSIRDAASAVYEAHMLANEPEDEPLSDEACQRYWDGFKGLTRAAMIRQVYYDGMRAPKASEPAAGAVRTILEDLPITETMKANALSAILEGLATPPAATKVPKPRCSLCNYQHGHCIGCPNNPVDIALRTPAAAVKDSLTTGKPDPAAPPAGSDEVRDALQDLLNQVDAFCVQQGEADFETARARAALAAVINQSLTTGSDSTDAARLDYLQRRGATVEILPGGAEQCMFRIGGSHAAVSYDLRAAIDAALAAGSDNRADRR